MKRRALFFSAVILAASMVFPASAQVITHRWRSRNVPRSASVRLDDAGREQTYAVNTGPGKVTNLAVEFECPVE